MGYRIHAHYKSASEMKKVTIWLNNRGGEEREWLSIDENQ